MLASFAAMAANFGTISEKFRAMAPISTHYLKLHVQDAELAETLNQQQHLQGEASHNLKKVSNSRRAKLRLRMTTNFVVMVAIFDIMAGIFDIMAAILMPW